MRGTTVEEMYKLEVVRVNEWIEKRKGHNFTVVDDDLDIVTSGGQGGGGDEDYNSADTEEMITQMKRPKVVSHTTATMRCSRDDRVKPIGYNKYNSKQGLVVNSFIVCVVFL